MNRLRSVLRVPRIALWLAFLAALSHVALGQASLQHHVRMLASGAGQWAEVCTPSGVRFIAPTDSASSDNQDAPVAPAAQMAECLACSVAAFSLPPTSIAGYFFADVLVQAVVAPRPLPVPVSGAFSLRPPPRAPPRLS